jgi:hypothetical protein
MSRQAFAAVKLLLLCSTVLYAAYAKKQDPRDIHPNKVVVTYTPNGGLGNQIEYMIATMSLAREHGFAFMPQPIPNREICNLTEKASQYWDIGEMRKGVPLLVESLPADCDGKYDILFEHRDKRQNHIYPPFRNCSKDYFAAVSAPFAETSRISTWSLEKTKEPPTIDLGRNILTRAHEITAANSERKHVCVWLDNYVLRSNESRQAPEMDFKHLQASTRLRTRVTSLYPLSTMLVLHMRTDENFCQNTPKSEKLGIDHVCLRSDRAKFHFKFVPVRQMATTLYTTMRQTGCTSIYFTKSPYAKQELRDALSAELTLLGARVENPVAAKGISTEANFLEREIASKVRTFIGELGSSWSGTICRKRQSRGATPVMWAFGLETCHEEGHGCPTLGFEDGVCQR